MTNLFSGSYFKVLQSQLFLKIDLDSIFSMKY